MVFHEGKWHLFATHRRASGKVDIQYLSFTDWKDAAQPRVTRSTFTINTTALRRSSILCRIGNGTRSTNSPMRSAR